MNSKLCVLTASVSNDGLKNLRLIECAYNCGNGVHKLELLLFHVVGEQMPGIGRHVKLDPFRLEEVDPPPVRGGLMDEDMMRFRLDHVVDRGEQMRELDEVAAMLRLKALGCGVRRIAPELGCSHMTVRRYLAAGGWTAYQKPERPRMLDGLEGWLAERFR